LHFFFFRFIFASNTLIMGKGDKKSKKGKIHIGSYGVRRRPKKKNSPAKTASASK
jgi:ribosomal small subunit protein bTHX